MQDPDGGQTLAAARATLARPLTFPEVLAKLGGRDRASAERRVTALAALPYPDRARVWQRLACGLMTLAPDARFAGRQTVEFFAPDGLYRMQVFALEDLQDGNLTVYCPDVVAEAVAAGLLAPTGRAEPDAYVLAATAEPLRIDALDGTALNPGILYKNLTYWKRRAVRATLPPDASEAQVEATELLCALAARHFDAAAPPAGAAPAAGT
ncbi:MAG: hypothetical protein JWO31_4150 [Phycisphaerales bacterium]|nr:hypothetical protein [Phycisphaerales bacterium]